MKYIEVKDFKCDNCGSEEYSALFDKNKNITIICDNCGTPSNKEYSVIEED